MILARVTTVLIAVCLLICPGVARADVLCDGIDDVLTTGVPLSSFVNANGFTIMGWLKTTGGATGATTCYDGDVITRDGDGNVAIGRADTDVLCGYMYDGTDRVITAPLTPGWHHVSLRFNGGSLRMHIDGNFVSGPNGVGNVSDLTHLVMLCSAAAGAGASADRITNVRYFNAYIGWWIDITAKSRLWGGHARSDTQPTAFWPLDDCAHGTSGHGLPFRDLSGNGRHLTGSHGATTTGLLCQGNDFLIRPWGIQ